MWPEWLAIHQVLLHIHISQIFTDSCTYKKRDVTPQGATGVALAGKAQRKGPPLHGLQFRLSCHYAIKQPRNYKCRILAGYVFCI